MKKMLIMAIALTLFIQGAASAEPDMLVGTRAAILPAEGVSLRTEPSASAEALCQIPAGAEVTVLSEAGGGYTRVSYAGGKGYVPSNALDYVVSLGGLSIMSGISDARRENLDRFLTTFTETNFADLSGGAFYLTDESGPLLAAFAARRVRLDAPGEIEAGSYEGGANARVPVAVLAPVVERFFGVKPDGFGSADGYYQWQETDDQPEGDSAVLTNIIDMGGGEYVLYFDIVGAGSEAHGTGRAAIHANSLDEYDGFTLSSIAVNE